MEVVLTFLKPSQELCSDLNKAHFCDSELVSMKFEQKQNYNTQQLQICRNIVATLQQWCRQKHGNVLKQLHGTRLNAPGNGNPSIEYVCSSRSSTIITKTDTI